MKPLNKYKFKRIIALLLLIFTLGQALPGYAQIYRNDDFSPVIAQSYADPRPLKPPADFLNEEQQQNPEQIDKGLLEEALAVLLQALVVPVSGEIRDIEAEISSAIDRYLSEQTSAEERRAITYELAKMLEYNIEKQKVFIGLFTEKCRGNKQAYGSIIGLYRRCVKFTSGDLGDNPALSDKITALIIDLGEEYNQKSGYARERFEELVSMGNIVLPHILKAIVYGNDNVRKWSRLALNILCEQDRELFLGIWDIVSVLLKEAREKGQLFTNEDFAKAIKRSGIIEIIDIDYLIDEKLLMDIISLSTAEDSVLGKKITTASQSLTSGKKIARYILMNLIKSQRKYKEVFILQWNKESWNNQRWGMFHNHSQHEQRY